MRSSFDIIDESVAAISILPRHRSHHSGAVGFQQITVSPMGTFQFDKTFSTLDAVRPGKLNH
jgi:hypothetical protein